MTDRGRADPASELFAGPGEVRALARTLDWVATPLGWPETWSPALRTATRAMLDAPVPICLWAGPQYALVYNDAYRRILAAKHPTALGQPGAVVWAEIWAGLEPQFAQVRAGGPPVSHEDARFVMARREGGRTEDAWFSYSLSPLRDEDGSVAAVLNISPETTGRVVAERALAVERARLEDVFRRAPSFIVAYRGPAQVYEFVNDAYYQLVGHRELLGKPLLEALPEVRGQGFDVLLERVRQTGEPWVGRETPVMLQRTPGAPPEARYLDMVFQPLTDADGTRSGVVAHGADVTDQVLARREVERLLGESERARAEAEAMRVAADAARAEAEAASRAKAEFLATMSHELRTPLNAIGGYAELLELGIRGPVTEEQRRDLGRIQQSQRHLLGLVNEVLDLARVDSGELRVERAAVRAGDTVDAALALVRPQAAAKALALAEACGGAADRPYLGDEPRVRQVLVNLLANAVKFTGSGGRVAVTCAVTDAPPPEAALAADTPYVALRVEDTGVGIAPDQHARIFEPFTQAEGGLTRPRGGTGLGLAISRRLARLMGGDLTVESEVGAGSAFTLWLPTPERRARPRPHGAGRAAGRAASRLERQTPPMTPAVEGPRLARVGEALVTEVGPVVRAWVVRLRADPEIPDAAARTDAELEDHAATFVTDVALALRTMGQPGGEPAALLRDGTAIMALIAERHGAQRARLGWPEAAVVREFALLAEALEAAVRRLAGPDGGSDAQAAERAAAVVAQLLGQAARLSVGGYRLVTGAAGA